MRIILKIDCFFSQLIQIMSVGSGAVIISGILPLKISLLLLPKHLFIKCSLKYL